MWVKWAPSRIRAVRKCRPRTRCCYCGVPLQLPQPLALLARQDKTSLRSPRSASSCRNQLRSVCSVHPNSPANCFGDRSPTATTSTPPAETPADTAASSWPCSAPLSGFPRKHRGVTKPQLVRHRVRDCDSSAWLGGSDDSGRWTRVFGSSLKLVDSAQPRPFMAAGAAGVGVEPTNEHLPVAGFQDWCAGLNDQDHVCPAAWSVSADAWV
jgi:hypothetical protein